MSSILLIWKAFFSMGLDAIFKGRKIFALPSRLVKNSFLALNDSIFSADEAIFLLNTGSIEQN
ncbi:hypothetical protein C2U68_20330 [Methylomonas koyamae]|nr:hypothetical protein C2U68_20330 [Methylomonas koyamae]